MGKEPFWHRARNLTSLSAVEKGPSRQTTGLVTPSAPKREEPEAKTAGLGALEEPGQEVRGPGWNLRSGDMGTRWLFLLRGGEVGTQAGGQFDLDSSTGLNRVPQIHICLGPQNVTVSKPGSPQV